MNKKFFMSEDIGLILNGKSNVGNYFQNKNIIVPNESKIKEIRLKMQDNLKETYGDYEILPEIEMYKSMKRLAKSSCYPLYSFDEIYLNGDKNIQDYIKLTRIKVGDSTLLSTRNTSGIYEPFQIEVKRIANSVINQQGNNTNISLIDDVVFSGDLICNVSQEFEKYGVNVKEVLCAVCVKEGLDCLSSNGINVKTDYILTNVLDEVCERDFYFGMPQSGQNVLLTNGLSVKQPYFMPFGNPIERASVDEYKATDFSSNCLDCSIDLWREMQRQSNKEFLVEDLPEKIYNLNNQNEKIVDLLINAQQDLEQ